MPQLAPSRPPSGHHRGASPLVQSDANYLLLRIQDAFAAPDYQPPVLPAVGMELLELSRRPNIAFSEVEQLLNKDPMIAARVLRVAQSARYSSAAAVRSLRDAMVRIGIEGMGNLCLSWCLNPPSGSCPSGHTCTTFTTPIIVGAVQYGACVPNAF